MKTSQTETDTHTHYTHYYHIQCDTQRPRERISMTKIHRNQLELATDRYSHGDQRIQITCFSAFFFLHFHAKWWICVCCVAIQALSCQSRPGELYKSMDASIQVIHGSWTYSIIHDGFRTRNQNQMKSLFKTHRMGVCLCVCTDVLYVLCLAEMPIFYYTESFQHCHSVISIVIAFNEVIIYCAIGVDFGPFHHRSCDYEFCLGQPKAHPIYECHPWAIVYCSYSE